MIRKLCQFSRFKKAADDYKTRESERKVLREQRISFLYGKKRKGIHHSECTQFFHEDKQQINRQITILGSRSYEKTGRKRSSKNVPVPLNTDKLPDHVWFNSSGAGNRISIIMMCSVRTMLNVFMKQNRYDYT